LKKSAAWNLVAQLQLLGDRLIAAHIRVVKVIQQTAALADHDQQPAARAVVFFAGLQVFGQMVDPLGQQGNLHVGGTGVALVQFEFLNRLNFRFHTFFFY
jgi:hypothetical protein